MLDSTPICQCFHRDALYRPGLLFFVKSKNDQMKFQHLLVSFGKENFHNLYSPSGFAFMAVLGIFSSGLEVKL